MSTESRKTIFSKLLTDRCRQLKEEKKWSSVSRIVGEAVEDCIITLPCPVCHATALKKYTANQKSKDVFCEGCTAELQIKGTKQGVKGNKLTLLGAEYRTTCASVRENMVHYLIVRYAVHNDDYIVHDIYFIDRADINEGCIYPRKPLSSTARRAGWQGCTLVFSVFRSLL
jgi:type II restriction enzyme